MYDNLLQQQQKTHTPITGIPEEKKVDGANKVVKEIMAEKFPNSKRHKPTDK